MWDYRKQWAETELHVNKDTRESTRTKHANSKHQLINFLQVLQCFSKLILKCCDFMLIDASAEKPRGRRRRQGRYRYTGHVTFTGRDTTEQYKGSKRRDSLTYSLKSQQGVVLPWDGCMGVCFRLSPCTLRSISPGLYNILKPWGVERYPSPCFVFLLSQW